MLSPAFVLSLLLGSILGLAFFFLFGRKGARFVTYWAVGVAAFLVGQIIGALRPLTPLMLGEIHVVEATAVSAIALVVARLLKL